MAHTDAQKIHTHVTLRCMLKYRLRVGQTDRLTTTAYTALAHTTQQLQIYSTVIQNAVQNASKYNTSGKKGWCKFTQPQTHPCLWTTPSSCPQKITDAEQMPSCHWTYIAFQNETWREATRKTLPVTSTDQICKLVAHTDAQNIHTHVTLRTMLKYRSI